ncbi:MAG: hypothetical protein U5Q44_04215 [Dehalococcoidia bacterium]|nr:hypothetical protein [Dehalococcoidia bacterium]
MNDVVPTGERLTVAAIGDGAARESGPVVASRAGGLALHLPGELPWSPGDGVFLVWHTDEQDMIAVATFRRVVAEVALFELLSPFRRYNRRAL